MKKNIILWMSALVLTIAGLSSCSNDNDPLNSMTRQEMGDGNFVPEERDFVESVSDKTGTVCYDFMDESWFLLMDLPPLPDGHAYIDSAILYYTYALPQKYQQEGLKVKVSGDIYDYHFRTENHVVLGGHKYYYILLNEIELAE